MLLDLIYAQVNYTVTANCSIFNGKEKSRADKQREDIGFGKQNDKQPNY